MLLPKSIHSRLGTLRIYRLKIKWKILVSSIEFHCEIRTLYIFGTL